jgi:16S rRNA (uracil1498-N3)-methyltransferase
MRLFYTPDVSPTDENYTLSENESKHCIRVLRQTIGNNIVLIDGIGNWYDAEIIADNPKKCIVKILSIKPEANKREFNLHIAIAPTKNIDRTEWFIEKATEIGIDEITMLGCKNAERKNVKLERLNKIAVSAIKQSLKASLPKLNDLCNVKEFVDLTADFKGKKYIAHCIDNETKIHLNNLYTKGEDVIVLIGPEGDFTSEEVKLALNNGFKEISLGNNRLRTETAALYSCTAVNLINES